MRSLPASIVSMSHYTVEYTSSEHRGIVMYSEAHEAASPAGAFAYAKATLSVIAAKYGARGYRVKSADGRILSSDESSGTPS